VELGKYITTAHTLIGRREASDVGCEGGRWSEALPPKCGDVKKLMYKYLLFYEYCVKYLVCNFRICSASPRPKIPAKPLQRSNQFIYLNAHILVYLPLECVYCMQLAVYI